MTPPRLLPFLDAAPYRMAMGLRSLAPAEWIDIDDRYEADLREKERLLAERPAEVTGALPGSEPAAAEARDLLAEHLPARFPALFRRDAATLHGPGGRRWRLDEARPPLDLAGRWVQEDLCLMEAGAEGWTLTAASLCFPNRWRLADKLGRAMPAIHVPVPGYGERLGAPVDRFFDKLAADRMVWRANWGIQADARLFQPTGHGGVEGEDVTPAEVPDRLVLRVERQTLRRLPRSGAILFGIRTHVHPLGQVVADAATARALADAVRALPPDMAVYKSMTGFRAALLAWLDGWQAGAAAPT